MSMRTTCRIPPSRGLKAAWKLSARFRMLKMADKGGIVGLLQISISGGPKSSLAIFVFRDAASTLVPFAYCVAIWVEIGGIMIYLNVKIQVVCLCWILHRFRNTLYSLTKNMAYNIARHWNVSPILYIADGPYLVLIFPDIPIYECECFNLTIVS